MSFHEALEYAILLGSFEARLSAVSSWQLTARTKMRRWKIEGDDGNQEKEKNEHGNSTTNTQDSSFWSNETVACLYLDQLE